MTHLKFSRLALPMIIGLTSVSLSACKLSDLVGDDKDNTRFIALQGRAANADGPLAGATIQIKDSAGNEFTVFSNASGYFSLRQDTADEEYRELVAPIILRTDYNRDTYHSVLCNIVYSNLSNAIDTVNLTSLTEYVMNITSDTEYAYENWPSERALMSMAPSGPSVSYNYCDEDFANNFNTTAATLDTDFNFFNTLFDANGTGFGAVLQSFDADSFVLDNDVFPPAFRTASAASSTSRQGSG